MCNNHTSVLSPNIKHDDITSQHADENDNNRGMGLIISWEIKNPDAISVTPSGKGSPIVPRTSKIKIPM